VAVLGRQPLHRSRRHVGRVGEDQVEAARQRLEQVRAHQPDARAPGQVPARHRERGGRNVGGRDPGAREGPRGEDRQAARAGAQVEHGLGRRQILQQEGDVRARNNDALVDVEALSIEPGFAQQVGHRDALPDSSFDQGFDLCGAALAYRVAEILGERQAQRPKDQEGRLVAGMFGAVAVVQPCRLEPFLRLRD
jgi:hypothetical protein